MAPQNNQLRVGSNLPFVLGLSLIGGLYVFLILAMVVADLSFTSVSDLQEALASPEIRYAIKLSLFSCSLTAILSVWVAVPLGYLMSRYSFRGKGVLDAILDIPIVLPPLVIGLSLLILFQTAPGQWLQENILPVTYKIPSIILAQFSVACAFAVRTMRVTFDQIPPRNEQVALTLGCSSAKAFWLVAIPEAKRGIITALTFSWARALGEFGPILIFSGATRMHTEVLSTTVFLELSVGNIGAAVAVSLLMILVAVIVLILVRLVGTNNTISRGDGGMIQVHNLSIQLGRFELDHINFKIPTGAYAVLMGKTGSGKTSIMEAICGLRRIRSGRITLMDQDVTRLKPGQRGVGFVPQDKALFNTMTVEENLSFALTLRKWDRPEINKRVNELAQLLGLEKLLDRKPAGLSGGEAQRVALGRALAARPDILCLDEPLSALDDETRDEMHSLLQSVREHTPVTILHVTHHVSDAEKLADCILFLKESSIQTVSVADLHRRSSNPEPQPQPEQP